jgi:hypothetical protein
MRSTRSSGPPVNTVSWPFSAGALVPRTGASTNATPASAAIAASRPSGSTPTVAICSQVAPGRADARAPSITDAVTSPSASMVTTRSAAATASAGVPATRAPDDTRRWALDRSRFHTVTGPAAAHRAAMAPPMIPVPRTLIAGWSDMPSVYRHPADSGHGRCGNGPLTPRVRRLR